METTFDIAKSVKAQAKKMGKSHADLAEALGITKVALWSRLKDPKLSTLEQIAGILGVPLSSFFSDEGFSTGGLVCPHCGAELKLMAK